MRTLTLTLLCTMTLLAGIPGTTAGSMDCNEPTAGEAVAMPSLAAVNGDDRTYYVYLNLGAEGGPALQFWGEGNGMDGLQTEKFVCDGHMMRAADQLLDAPPLL